MKYKIKTSVPDDIRATKLNTSLYLKMELEFDNFIDNLKTLSPEKIIESSYEKVFKEEILNCFDESNPLDEKQAKALLSKKNPLDYLYQEWLDMDSSYIDLLVDSIKHSADKEIQYGKNNRQTEITTR